MNIWIFNHYADPPTRQATRSYDLGRALVVRGHRVTIFASSFSHYTLKEEELVLEEHYRVKEYNGVTFVWVGTTPYRHNGIRRMMNMLSFAGRSLTIGLRRKDRPDIIIGTTVHPFAPLAAYIVSRIKKSRFFYEITDLWPQALIDMGVMSLYHPGALFMRFLETFLTKRAEKIITLLPFADEYLMTRGVPKNKIVWIPNGVDLSRQSAASLTARTQDPSRPFIVMYVGGHAHYHGLENLLNAAELLQQEGERVRWVFVGSGSEKMQLIERARTMRLKNVEFRNAVPKERLLGTIQEADTLVHIFRPLPVHRYGVSSVKVFDYLVSGCPVIYAGISRNNPVSEANAGITVSPDDPSAIATAIRTLIHMDLEERNQMGARGIEYVRAHHNIAMLATRLESMF